MKSHEYIYKKILRDVKKYISNSKDNKKLYYIDDDGEETEAVFDLGIHANIQFAKMAEYIHEEREKVDGRADHTENDDGHTDS